MFGTKAEEIRQRVAARSQQESVTAGSTAQVGGVDVSIPPSSLPPVPNVSIPPPRVAQAPNVSIPPPPRSPVMQLPVTPEVSVSIPAPAVPTSPIQVQSAPAVPTSSPATTAAATIDLSPMGRTPSANAPVPQSISSPAASSAPPPPPVVSAPLAASENRTITSSGPEIQSPFLSIDPIVPRQGIFVHGPLSYFHNPLSYYFDGPQQQPNAYDPHRDQTDGVYVPFSGGSRPMYGTPVGMGYAGQPYWGAQPQPYGFGFQPYAAPNPYMTHGTMYPSTFTGSHIPYDFYGMEMGPDGKPRMYGAFITEIHK